MSSVHSGRVDADAKGVVLEKLRCPRCAYDLAGAVDAWNPQGHDSEGAKCPLRGVCSECGLEFEWRVIFRPQLGEIVWFVETPRPPRRNFAFVRTLWRVAIVRPFWTRVTVETPIHWRGVAAWLVLLALVIIVVPTLVYVSSDVSLRLSEVRRWGTPIGGIARDALGEALYFAAESVRDLRYRAWDSWQCARYPSWIRVGLACTLAFPLTFLLLPWTRAKSKVRAALVMRAWAYALAWPVPLLVWAIVSWTCSAVWVWLTPTPWAPPRATSTGEVFFRLIEALADSSPFNWSRSAWWSARVPDWIAIIPYAWCAAFWMDAMKRSWRMPDWLPAWLSCCAVAFVLSFLLMLLDEEFLRGFM